MAKKKDAVIVDLFAGAGGTSEGVARACERLERKPTLIAINHWELAIRSHQKNHPWARHLCTGIDAVDPVKEVPSGRVDLLVASPECVHHSNARGGRPMNDQSRASAWLIIKWLTDLYVDDFLIENVKEMIQWGPLNAKGRPVEALKGTIFKQFLEACRSCDYHVEYKILCAADYGDATTRERLFIRGRRRRLGKVSWPDATHGPDGRARWDPHNKKYTYGVTSAWKPARQIIDWTIPSRSIFNRTKPLAPATLERIAHGLKKFGGDNAEPYLVVLRNHMAGRSLNDPLPTITADGNHFGLCTPMIINAGGPEGQGRNARTVDQPLSTVLTEDRHGLVTPFIAEMRGESTTRSVEEPLSTVTTKGAHHGVVEPFYFNMQRSDESELRDVHKPMPTITATSSDFAVVQPFAIDITHGEGSSTRGSLDLNQPMPTITTAREKALIQPFLLTAAHGDEGPTSRDRRSHSIEEPMPTVTTALQHGVVEPVLVSMEHGGREFNVDKPMPTITSADAWGVAQFMVAYRGAKREGDNRTADLDQPLPTQDTSNRFALVEPLIASYYGTQNVSPVSEPLPTVTTKDRFALIEFAPGKFLDIHFRMLKWKELARAHSFPETYEFEGSQDDIVKQIGNSVPTALAEALTYEALNMKGQNANT